MKGTTRGPGKAAMKATTISTPLVQAIENAWSAIQAKNADVPDVVVTLGSGVISRGMKLGHFAANVWTRGDSDVHELFVGGEGLQRGASALMATLIHEASHAAAEARGIKDTSRQGRYHNKNFKAIAEELGIEVNHSETLGWSNTVLPDETAALYESEILDLDASLTAYRHGFEKFIGLPTSGSGVEKDPDDPKPSNNNYVAAVCECGRRIRVAPSVLEMGDIVCGVCGMPFAR